jgi:peroxiredoxin
MIVELSDKYEGKGLKVYYFSADWSDRKDVVIKFLVDHGVKGLSFMKVDGNDNQFIRDIHEKWTGALPFTIVFDKNGNISDYWEMMKSKDHFELAIKKAIKL